MVAEWYCQVMGSEVGPLTQHELVDMVRNHRINPEDLIRRNESSWVAAFEVKGLFEAAAKPPSSRANTTETSSEQEASVPSVDAEEVRDETHVESPRVRQDPAHAQPEPAARPAPTKIARIDKGSDNVNDWFCIASGEKRGPLGFDELQAMASEGSLRGRDRVWRASWPKFQKAADVDGLDV